MTVLINIGIYNRFAGKIVMKNDKKKIKKKKTKFKIDIKNMGVNIDKNEYREIVLSNSNHPEKF